MQIVEFTNKLYIVEPGPGAPREAKEPRELSGPEQVELHNLLVSNLGAGNRVKKFSDRETGAKRCVKLLKEWAAQPLAGDPQELPKEPKKKAAKKTTTKKKTTKKAAEKPAKAEAKKRGMRFVFPYHGAQKFKGLKSRDSLRGRCATLLEDGCTFERIKEEVVAFDEDRGVVSKSVERRAYEVIRLLHYYTGYGVSHDQSTGIIKLHQGQG